MAKGRGATLSYDKARKKEADRKRNAKNRERVSERNKKYHAEHRDQNLARRKKNWPKEGLLKRYGLSLADYDRLLEQQAGGCAICGGVTMWRGEGRLSVDHDHETGEVRGLLCSPCNTGLGHFHDDAERLRRAIIYLEGN